MVVCFRMNFSNLGSRTPIQGAVSLKNFLAQYVTFGIPATCYRTENAQIPKSAGESAGKSARKKRTAGGTAGSSAGRPVSLEKQRNGTAPSSPPSSHLFPGTLPSTLPGTFGDLGVLSPVAGRWDSNVRSDKLQNESSPNFSKFCPEFSPEFCSEFSPNFFEDFSCFVSWETETRKNSPKSPAIFQCKIPRQTRKNYSQYLFWRAGKVTI